MKRSKLCEQFLENQGVDTCSIQQDETKQDTEAYFSMRGCECCDTGLGNNVYDCIGYAPKTKTVVEIGRVCHECICYFYNGDDSEVES